MTLRAEIGDERGPLVSTPGAGGTADARPHSRDDAETAPATALPPSDGGPSGPLTRAHQLRFNRRDVAVKASDAARTAPGRH